MSVNRSPTSELSADFAVERIRKKIEAMETTAAATYVTESDVEAIVATQYALKYDQDADPPTVAYLGQAVPGSGGASAVWRIQKLTFGGDGDVTATWADGNANFDNVWNDRASLSYS